MNKPHKHAAEIKAWADGAQVQFWGFGNTWTDLKDPEWFENVVYRVKPDPLAKFKKALDNGERVDVRAVGLPPGYGWSELSPLFDNWGLTGDHIEYRIARPWQDERDAYDRGEKIQVRTRTYLGGDWTGGWNEWIDLDTENVAPLWSTKQQYRVKPKATTETFNVGALMQWSPGPHDGIALRPSPFNIPTIALDITYADGIVTNVTLKDWHA